MKPIIPRMTAVARLLADNQGRDPALLALKWKRMRGSPFAFFRGTAPLFYRSWARAAPGRSPLAWICGDAHLENIGSYRGSNRVAYFDLNDFDEACLAPVDWEVGRALAGLFVLGKPLMARRFLSTYLATLAGGKPGHIELEVAVGPIAKLLSKVQKRSRRQFLAPRVSRGLGRLKIRPGHSYLLPPAVKAAVRRRFAAWARRQPDPAFYRVLDVCGRIAGIGSLGVPRYILLVKGKRLPFILDMKAAAPAAPRARVRTPPPGLPREAERVATIQYFLQYVPIARLGWIGTAPVSFVVRALQPTEDRVDETKLSAADYGDFIGQWARLVASAHLRSGGWKGSAALGQLIGYGRSLSGSAQRHLLAAARRTASLQQRAFAQFKASPLGRA